LFKFDNEKRRTGENSTKFGEIGQDLTIS